MNNRLLELAQEAELSANLGNAIDIKLMMKNYAQLIIKECVGICDNVADEFLTKSPWGVYSDYAHGADSCSYEIAKHFGEEECSVCGTTENVKYVGGYQPYLCGSVECIPF